MDAFTDPKVDMITWMKSARVGYTKILNHCLGYCIHHDPKSALMVQPTVEDAQGYSKEELAPMLRDTPVLQGVVAPVKSRDSNNTILKKSYPGGFVNLVGANSARGFRRISTPIVLFDEVDGYPPSAGQEGDQIKLGIMRSQYYWDRKILIGSTPTVKGLSRVEDSFNLSDKRYCNVPCPHCGEMQVLQWGGKDADFGIRWPEGRPEDAYYLCCACHEKIQHAKKRWMIDRCEWRATEEFKGHAGFHIWAAYSLAPNAAWGQLASEFVDCKDNQDKFKTYVNTVWGQTWDEPGTQPEWKELAARCEPYKLFTVPDGGWVLTLGADIQANRAAVVVKAWGEGEENWQIYHTEFYGDPETDEFWAQMDEILYRDYRHVSGNTMKIVAAAVDSGYRTQAVYNYARHRFPLVMAVKGSNQSGSPILSTPTWADVAWMGEKIKGGCQLWRIGTDTAKSTIYSRLGRSGTGPGVYHWPIGTSDEYFQQLTAEKIITRYVKGHPVHEWHVVRPGGRNEALDCEVYAYAAALRAGIQRIDFERIKSPDKPRRKPVKRERSGGFVNRGGGFSGGGRGWLSR